MKNHTDLYHFPPSSDMISPASAGSSSSSAGRGKRLQPVPRLGNISFPCSDCSLTFSTHQALGGHRKLHTKLLDPEARKELRRQRRKILSKTLEEEEEWHDVEIQVSDNGQGGKFIEFLEIRCERSTSVVPVLSESSSPEVESVHGAVKRELDLTLHL